VVDAEAPGFAALASLVRPGRYRGVD